MSSNSQSGFSKRKAYYGLVEQLQNAARLVAILVMTVAVITGMIPSATLAAAAPATDRTATVATPTASSTPSVAIFPHRYRTAGSASQKQESGGKSGDPGGGSDASARNKTDHHPNIENSLLRPDRQGPKQADTNTGSLRRAIITFDEGHTKAGIATIRANDNVSLRLLSGQRASVVGTPSGLKDLATADSTGFVREPTLAVAEGHTTRGVEVIGADDVPGRTGSNTTVAVIDFGFNTSNPEISDNIIATKDFRGTGIDGDGEDRHGTASAELVVDTAPDVNLVLVTAKNSLEIREAINYVDARNDVDTLSMSLGFPGGTPLDGSGVIDRELDQLRANGTLPVLSAGNYGNGQHWNGTYQDSNGDNITNYNGSSRQRKSIFTPDGTVSLTLQWDDFYQSDQDYDLYLYDPNGNLVAQSTDVQDGTQIPVERILYSGSYTEYEVEIVNANASGDARFDLWAPEGTIANFTRTRSVTPPSTARGVVSVAAIDSADGSIQPFSSRGPTLDGRTKPDIAGVDNVSADPYRDDGIRYTGTSAAAPYVAGVSALIEGSDDPRIADISDLATRLTDTALIELSQSPNNITGNGLVFAPRAVAPYPPADVTVDEPYINRSLVDNTTVSIDYDPAPETGSVSVLLQPNGSGSAIKGEFNVTEKTSATQEVNFNATGVSEGPATVQAVRANPAAITNPGGIINGSTTEIDTTQPEVAGFSLDGPAIINKSLAGSSVPVDVTFSEPMDDKEIINGTVIGPAGNYSLDTPTNGSGGYETDTNYNAEVTIADTGSEGSAEVLVDVAHDDVRNDVMLAKIGSVPIDTKSPQDPAELAGPSGVVNISDAEGGISVDVMFTNPVEAGALTIQTEAPNGSTNNVTKAVQSGVDAVNVTDIPAPSGQEGTLEIRAKYTDSAGNENPSGFQATSANITIDTKRPVIQSFSASPNKSNVTTTIDANENLTSLRLAANTTLPDDIREQQDNTTTPPYEITVGTFDDGGHQILLDSAVDEAGNQYHAKNIAKTDSNITIDANPPVLLNSSFITTAPNSSKIGNGTEITFTAEFEDIGSNVSSAAVTTGSITGDTETTMSEINNSGVYNVTITANSTWFEQEGSVTVDVTAEDQRGNAAAYSTYEVILDSTPPQDPSAVTVSPSPINASKDNSVQFGVNFTQPTENVTLDVRVRDSSGEMLTRSQQLGTNVTNHQFRMDVSKLSEGTLTTEVRLTDDANLTNPSGYTATNTTAYDATAPQPENFSATEPLDNELAITFDNVTASDEFKIRITGAETQRLTESDFEFNNGTQTFSGTFSDGDYTIELVNITDDVGNTRGGIVAQDSVTVGSSESTSTPTPTEAPSSSEGGDSTGGGGGSTGGGGSSTDDGGDSIGDNSEVFTNPSTPTPVPTPPPSNETIPSNAKEIVTAELLSQAGDSSGSVSASIEPTVVERIEANETAARGQVTVAELDGTPPSVPDPEMASQAVVAVTVPRPAENEAGKLVFDGTEFKGPLGGLTVLHYDDRTGSWERLPTEVQFTTDGPRVIAETASFSVFAVAQESPTPTRTPIPVTAVQEDSPTDTPTSTAGTDTATSVPDKSPTPTPTDEERTETDSPSPTNGSGPGFGYFAALLAFIASGLLLGNRQLYHNEE